MRGSARALCLRSRLAPSNPRTGTNKASAASDGAVLFVLCKFSFLYTKDIRLFRSIMLRHAPCAAVVRKDSRRQRRKQFYRENVRKNKISIFFFAFQKPALTPAMKTKTKTPQTTKPTKQKKSPQIKQTQIFQNRLSFEVKFDQSLQGKILKQSANCNKFVKNK